MQSGAAPAIDIPDVFLLRRDFGDVVVPEIRLFSREGALVGISPAAEQRNGKLALCANDREVVFAQKRHLTGDAGNTFDVMDGATGLRLGAVRHCGFVSMIRDQWQLLDGEDKPLGFIREGLLRGVLHRWLFSGPQVFHVTVAGARAGKLSQQWNPVAPALAVDVSGDGTHRLERRFAAAAALIVFRFMARNETGRFMPRGF